MTMVNSFPDKMNLSFSGCGFLCIYHAGVAAAIKEYAPQLCENKISGASAGAIVAAGLLCDVCISQATSTILRIVSQARSRALGPLHPAFNLLGLVREELVKTLPPDAYARCTKRLQISLTRWVDKKNVMVCEYDSNEELIDAIICSCFIPVYCGILPPTYRGVAYIDGGFTDNQPSYDDHTVTVSPFSGESDICPPDWDSASFFGISFSRTSIRFTTRNLFRLTACLMPPSTDDCSKMCLQGFEDALRFLTKNGMSPCIRCLTIQTNIEHGHQTELTPPDKKPFLRKRNSSNVLNRRQPFESECETCCESEHMYNASVGTVFPSIMKKTFDEAFAAEDSFFKYLLSWRMFRYARTALGVSKLPFDMMIIMTKNVTTWMTMVSAPEWIIKRLTGILEFVQSEIDNQKTRYSMFSCQLALTELDQTKVNNVHVDHKEVQYEMSDQARRELATLRECDRRRKRRMAAQMSPTSSNANVDWSDIGGHGPDSLEHVIEYTQNHDAMYAFHYLDENNKMKSCELFNMAENHKRHACHERGSQILPISSEHRPVSMVLEEDELKEEELELEPTCSNNREDADSGLSGIEQQPVSKRDACCSPVRTFDPPSPSNTHHRTSSFRNKQAARRQANSAASAPVSRRISTMSPEVGVSSDSEVDAADRLFVPVSSSRRSRRQSTDYDGEPEPSDTDVNC